MDRFTITPANLSRYNEIKAHYGHLYTHTNTVPARRLLERPGEICIWMMEGLSHSAIFFATDQFISSYSPRSLYLFTLPFWHAQHYYHASLRFILEVAPQVRAEQLVVLGNGFEEVLFAREAGMSRSFFCNHNCWLDPNLFTHQATPKQYDLVLNTRPESWKRPDLAAAVPRLAIIKGHHFRKHDFFELESLQPALINKERLTPDQVVSILNASYCGGIFSQIEGACYSSSEYLLCGLPVISTTSQGGRDIWYDQFNSVILAENTAAAVLDAVEHIKRRTEQGYFVPQTIRNRHISLQDQFIDGFKQMIAGWLDAAGFALDVDAWFKTIYQHKMIHYAPLAPP